MSTLEEKLLPPERPSTGRAQATMKQPERRFGSPQFDPKKPLELALIDCMGFRECWKRLPDGTKGWDTNYELLEKTPIEGKGKRIALGRRAVREAVHARHRHLEDAALAGAVRVPASDARG